MTVTAVDDSAFEGMHLGTITQSVSSLDPFYSSANLTVPSVIAHISDNDGITVTPVSGLSTTQSGGTAQFTVVLDHQPTVNVTIGLSTSDATQGVVSSAPSLTFTHDNWNVAQTVTVTGVNDNIVRNNVTYTIVTAPAVSTDPMYNNTNAPDVSVTNNNTDTAGVNISPTSGLQTTVSGGTAQFTVKLNSKPLSDVTIVFSSNSAAGVINDQPTEIANYINDYSSVQGHNGWNYCYLETSDNTIRPMTWVTEPNGSNSGQQDWTSPSGSKFYTVGSGASAGSVLRYIAPEDGTYLYSGNIAKPQFAVDPTQPGTHGNGVIAHLSVNGQEIQSYVIGGDDTVGVQISFTLGLKAGDKIDLYIDPNVQNDGRW